MEDIPTSIQQPSLPITSITSRRAALLSVPSLASAMVLMMGAGADVTHAAAAAVDWASVRKDIIEVIADPNSPGGIGEKGPTLVRLGRSWGVGLFCLVRHGIWRTAIDTAHPSILPTCSILYSVALQRYLRQDVQDWRQRWWHHQVQGGERACHGHRLNCIHP